MNTILNCCIFKFSDILKIGLNFVTTVTLVQGIVLYENMLNANIIFAFWHSALTNWDQKDQFGNICVSSYKTGARRMLAWNEL